MLARNILGNYGDWAARYLGDQELEYSFLHPRWSDRAVWQAEARRKYTELLALPFNPADLAGKIEVRTGKTYHYQDLEVTELTWRLPYGPKTESFFLKPAGSSGKLPGVLALHDHGGVKYFGKQKITRTSKKIHPIIRNHQEEYYGGVAWANELAKLGFGVLVHDVFPFESRKILASDVPGLVVERLMASPRELGELVPEDMQNKGCVEDFDVGTHEPVDQIEAYNAFANQHEHFIAKSLFSAGLVWPGLFVLEDTVALAVLCSRPEIDQERVGCCGLSGGGLRTNYLAALDQRVRCSVTVGFMTTWRDFLLNKCFTHTWMVYIPHLPRYMDYPDILGMRVPLPTMVQATDLDPLYSLDEVKAAADRLRGVYAKADSSETFTFSLYPGPHKFDLPMQDEAFRWLERWL